MSDENDLMVVQKGKTKQQEIREGLAEQLYRWLHSSGSHPWNDKRTSEVVRHGYRKRADEVLASLDSQGVVLKVPRKHDSDCAVHNEPAYRNGPCDCKVLPVGCVYTERLI